MKFSHSWLLKYLKTTSTPSEIAKYLVDLGLEVESVIDIAEKLKGFVYAKVVTREKHPNADRLSLCRVDAGTGELIQVVCGAPNVKADMGVAFASVGTVIPVTGEALKKGKIRDVESCGMLCSARELELGEDSDGIMDLGLDYKPGTPLTNILKLDAVYDVSITPNRGDCFAVYGIARDLSVIGVGELIPLSKPVINESNAQSPLVSIETSLCSKFVLRKIEGVNNKSFNDEIQNLLNSAGQKTISALVDVTNYMCIGLGRPMHVFDVNKVKGNIVIREAVQGEKFSALDDNEYTLDAGMIVIADDTGVISLAGIMGGKSTCVDENTKNVLLESALFDSVSIAKTGQKLNLISDSRMRFERGVDSTMVEPCVDIATSMIIEICGGKAGVKTIQTNGVESALSIDLNPELIKKRLGLDISHNEIQNIFEKLGCQVKIENNLFKVSPPTWRHDLTIPEDLTEEIARIKGYQNINAVSLPLKKVENEPSRIALHKYLAQTGFLETINWSFIDNATALKFIDNSKNLLTISNPISEELNTMRPSLVASLLKIAQKNVLSARYNAALFEIAPIYGKQFKNFETLNLSGLRFGQNHTKHWNANQRNVDVYDAKSDVLAVLNYLGMNEQSLQIYAEGPDYYHPGRKGCLKQGNKVIAYFGEIHPLINADFASAAFEIFLENIPAVKNKKIQKTFSNLMPVRRDFAFVLDVSIPSQALIKAIEKSNAMVESVEVFDSYQGTHVEKGKKSLAVSVILQPNEKTLSETELLEIHNAIEANAAKIGAVLRG